MKKNILIIILIFAFSLIGFFAGFQIGIGKQNNTNINKPDLGPLGIKDNTKTKVIKKLTYKELKKEIVKKEIKNILKYLKISGEIVIKREGSLFNKKDIKYFNGIIKNNLILLPIKDIKVKIDFYSHTNTLIESKTIIIYDYISPQNELHFMEKINIPDNMHSIKYKILDAKSANKDFKDKSANC